MKFLVPWKVFETITQAQISPQRVNVGQGIQQMVESPKEQTRYWSSSVLRS